MEISQPPDIDFTPTGRVYVVGEACAAHSQFEPCQHVDHMPTLPKKFVKAAEVLRLNPDLLETFLPLIEDEHRDAFSFAVRPDGESGGRRSKLTKASDIKEKRIRWLWAGRIPLGELTFIIGKGGVGKSTELARQVALITNGKMEGEHFGTPHNIIYVASEDSWEATVKPRMVAAGADLDRVYFHRMVTGDDEEETQLILEQDLPSVVDDIRSHEAVAVFFDPLSSNLGGDRNKGHEMRPIMEKIRRAAEMTGSAFIGLGHVKKERVTNIIDAFLGSVEMSNVCRSAMGAVADPDAEDGEPTYILSQEKHNLGPKPPSLQYRIEGVQYDYEEDGAVERMDTSRVVIIGETDRTASQVLEEAMASGGGESVREAADWLRETLERGGRMPRGDVMKASKVEGYSEASVKRAAKKLRVEMRREGWPSTSLWSLPPSRPTPEPTETPSRP